LRNEERVSYINIIGLVGYLDVFEYVNI
jgi:hypothetical protein